MDNRLTRRTVLGSLALTPAIGTLANADQSSSDDSFAGFAADHVQVNTADFERSVAWYREKLGFEEVVRWTVDGLDGTNLAYMQRGNFRIEIASGPATEQTA